MANLDGYRAAGRPGFFTSLVFPDYRRLWIATGCAQSASWALIVLRAVLVYDLTGSNAWVGFVTMSALMPSLVVTPLSGYLADRFDRRRLLALTYIFNLFVTVALALLVLGDRATELHILGLAVLNGIIRAAELPTNQALLPNLVPRDRLLNAVALNQLMQAGSRMFGPLLILPVIRFIEPEPAFFMSAGLYAVGLIQVLDIRTRSSGQLEAARGVLFNLAAGVHYMYTHPLILSLILLTVLHCAITMAFESVFPFYSRAQLGMESGKELFQGPTYLMIAVGAGSILGSLGLARVDGQRVRGQLFLILGLFSGITSLLLGFAVNVPTAMLAAVAMGAATAGFMTLSHGTIQGITPDSVRGRVMSANTWHVQGTMAGFNAVNGVLMDLPWMTATMLLAGSGLIFVSIMVASLLVVHLRSIYTRGMPAEALAR